MTHDPPEDFEEWPLVLETIGVGATWYRIYPKRFPDPLGVGASSSRFSAPDGETAAYKVLYAGQTFRTCFAEALIRDRGATASDGRRPSGLIRSSPMVFATHPDSTDNHASPSMTEPSPN